ncbi:MAG: hypothetical protein K6348_02600 [Deferribacterales bacterium]
MKGFTLVELVIIILLVGIIAMIVGPKVSIGDFKEETEKNSFIANIRYAQHKSMVVGGGWRVELGSKSYTIKDEEGKVVNLPGGENPVNTSVGISSNYTQFYFDYLGRPDNDNDSKNDNLINDNITITFGNGKVMINPAGGVE